MGALPAGDSPASARVTARPGLASGAPTGVVVAGLSLLAGGAALRGCGVVTGSSTGGPVGVTGRKPGARTVGA